MNDIGQARTDLTAALRFDHNPGNAVIPTGFRPEDADLAAFVRGQAASNESIEVAKRYVERSIDMLQNDSPDYGGYRVKAIDALQSARKELAAALEFRAHESRSSEVMTESDENLRFARLYVERSNDMLSHDQRDYGGHRVTAMNDLSQARSDLNSALKFDKNHEDAVLPTSAMPGDEDLEAFFVRGQFASNENIEYVRRYAERAIDLLQNDSHDYHGFRAKAIDDLQRARDQLVEALRFR